MLKFYGAKMPVFFSAILMMSGLNLTIAQASIVLEAEEAKLSGEANIVNCNQASGGKMVSGISEGTANSLEFQNIRLRVMILKPVIDGIGYAASIHIQNRGYLHLSNLAIKNDGGDPQTGEPTNLRQGIYIENTFNDGTTFDYYYLDNLTFKNIYPTDQISMSWK